MQCKPQAVSGIFFGKNRTWEKGFRIFRKRRSDLVKGNYLLQKMVMDETPLQTGAYVVLAPYVRGRKSLFSPHYHENDRVRK